MLPKQSWCRSSQDTVGHATLSSLSTDLCSVSIRTPLYFLSLCLCILQPVKWKGRSLYNGPAQVYRYMRFCCWLSSFQIGLITETKAGDIFNASHERPKPAMTTFARTLILWMWVFQLGYVGMSIFSGGFRASFANVMHAKLWKFHFTIILSNIIISVLKTSEINTNIALKSTGIT